MQLTTRDRPSGFDMSTPTVLVVQARMTSTRLPGKVLLPLAGRPLIEQLVRRAAVIEGIDAICVAIPDGLAHQPIAAAVAGLPRTLVVTGPEDDVLQRTLAAANATGAEIVVRITSDCPLFDPRVSGALLACFRAADVPYARTDIHHGFPLGFDTEIVTRSALEEAAREALDPYEREHVTPFIWRRPERYPALIVGMVPDLRSWRLVVDQPEDFTLCSQVYDALMPNLAFGLRELRHLFSVNPDLLKLNSSVPQHPWVGSRPTNTDEDSS